MRLIERLEWFQLHINECNKRKSSVRTWFTFLMISYQELRPTLCSSSWHCHCHLVCGSTSSHIFENRSGNIVTQDNRFRRDWLSLPDEDIVMRKLKYTERKRVWMLFLKITLYRLAHSYISFNKYQYILQTHRLCLDTACSHNYTMDRDRLTVHVSSCCSNSSKY